MPISRLHRLASLALAAAALLLATAASASAAVPFCPNGSGPGQCKNPAGVAVDTTNGRVYVADPGNNRVAVFTEDGEFISFFATPGSDPGQLSGARQVAVDDDPTSPNFGDVYVTDSIDDDVTDDIPPSPRLQRFSSTGAFEATIGAGVLHWVNPPIAVTPGGDLYVIDSVGPKAEIENRQVKVFDAAGTLIRSSTIGTGFVYDVAVDSTDNVFVARNNPTGTPVIDKLEPSEPTATLLSSFDLGANTTSLAIDSTDNLYAGQGVYLSGVFQRFIAKHDPSGAIVRRFAYGEVEANLEGLAVGATGELFGGEELGSGIRIAESPPGALPCCLTTTLGNTKATLKGEVNPEGKEATYHFEYLTEAEYLENLENEGEGGNGFTGLNLPKKTPESAPVGSDFELHPAAAEIGCATPENPPQPECLEPGTPYRHRLVATNADGSNVVVGQFTTKRPFELLETYATGAGTDAVRIHATINPLGIPATAHFEYVGDATYQASGFAKAAKTPSVDLGSGNTPVAIAAQLSRLVPGATYHYRAVVINASSSEEGPERTVTTFPLPKQPTNSCPNAIFRTGPSALLPDCRAYEMVSPVDKNGGDIKVLGQALDYPARLDQSADSGDAFTYSSVTAFAGALSAPWSSQYMARRGADGWATEAINPPRLLPSHGEGPNITIDLQYRLFTPELSEGWLFTDTDPPLDECAPQGFLNLYHRDNASGSYEALIPVKPKAIVYDYRLELQGTSTDGSRAVFRANAKLTKDASSAGGNFQLYMHIRDPEGEGCGQLRLVSFKPNGVASAEASSVGTAGQGAGEYREGMVTRGVSSDGSRIFLSMGALGGPGTSLHVRVNADQPQSAISAGKCTEADKGCTLQLTSTTTQFWTAAADGSRVIYSVGDELFEYDVDKALAGETAKTLITGGLKGVGGFPRAGVAASTEDASRIYFVSGEELEGEGKAGEPNLYLYEPAQGGPDRYRLVTTLSDLDLQITTPFGMIGAGLASPYPMANGVRISPDGSHLAFVSNASLTGFDNTDAATGKPTLQLYLYDAGTEDLRCVSCNPSGARPEGRRFNGLAGVTRYVSAVMPFGESQTFSPRALAPDGSHLFFESFEALLARDTNGKADAYEWQRAGSQAECNAIGAELYVKSSGGCLSLISTGQSTTDTEIADTTPDGSNVFIRTGESLLPQDPGLVDVYVARVNGGFPQPPSQPAACEGEACQGPPTPPNDPTPNSLGFQGAGNVKDTTKPRKPRCAKGKARSKGRCVNKKSSKRAGKASKDRRQGR